MEEFDHINVQFVIVPFVNGAENETQCRRVVDCADLVVELEESYQGLWCIQSIIRNYQIVNIE